MNILTSCKKDFKSIPLGIKLIVLVIFLRSLGWAFVDPFYSMYFQQFHNNYSAVGIFTAILALSGLLTIIPLMRLADKMKEAVLIRDGEALFLLVIFLYVLSGFFKSIPLLVFTLVLNGISHTLLTIGTEAYIRKHNCDGKAGPFGYYMAFDYFGWVLGMVIAAFTVQYYSLNSMFLFVLPSILLGFIILPHIHERGIKSLFRGIKKYFHKTKDIVDIYNDWKSLDSKMIFFLILSFFDGALKMFALIFIPLFALSINLDLRSIALLMAIMYMPYILSYFFSEISDRVKKMNVITTGLFIGALSSILLYFILDKVWVVVFITAISFSLAIIRPAYNGAITRLTPHSMLGEITSLNNFVERLGRIVGPITTGVIADIYGIKATFLFIALVAFCLGGFAIIFRGYSYIIDPEKCGIIK